jgi:hypothetical protein
MSNPTGREAAMSDYGSMNAAELMDRVFDVYKKSFIQQLAFAAVVGVISFILMVLLGFAAAMAVIIPMTDMPQSAFISAFITVLVVMLPIYIVWTATADAGHILFARQAFYGLPVRFTAKELAVAVVRVVTAAITQITLSIPWLLMMGFFVYILLRPVLGINMFDDPFAMVTPFLSNTWILITILGALAYVVYSNFFALAVPVAVFEKAIFHRTVIRSWALMKGEFWKILALRALWLAITYLFSYSAQGLWMLLMSVLNAFTSSDPMWVFTIGSIVQGLATILIGFLIGPLSGILTALIYFNQRIKKEGLDMEIALTRMARSLYPHLL